jgi:hypothetical protein
MRHPPHTVAQLYGLPHGILHIFNTILYENHFHINSENEFQSPQIFQQTINLHYKYYVDVACCHGRHIQAPYPRITPNRQW